MEFSDMERENKNCSSREISYGLIKTQEHMWLQTSTKANKWPVTIWEGARNKGADELFVGT